MMTVKLMNRSSLLTKAGYTREDEIDIYNRQLTEIQENPGWYLDNAYRLPEYQLSWVAYGAVNISPPRPKKKAL